MPRPNIVVFIPDQLRADALGCFGNPSAHTPAIDRLAAQGTRFADAWGQHPFCSQSRVSFLTGWYPHVAGHRTLNSLIKPWQPSILRALKDSGYHVAHGGLRGDTFAEGQTAEHTSVFGFVEPPKLLFQPNPYPIEHPMSRAFYHGARAADLGSPAFDMDEAVVRTAETWLADGLPEPWVLYLPLIFPHPPFEVEEPWFSMHDRADQPPPIPHDPAGRPGYVEAIHRTYGLDRLDLDDWAEIRATYAGMVSRVDHHLGRVLSAVERTGAEDRTAIFFFPDHGEYLGDHGLIEKWIAGLEPALVHNPLIVRVPGGAEHQVAESPVELLDVVATMAEIADVELGHRHFSRSLVGLLEDAATPHRAFAASEAGLGPGESAVDRASFPYDLKHGLERDRPELAGRATAIRTPAWTYIHRVADVDELYDRARDPDERHNLAADPDHAGTVAGLRTMMLDWLMTTADAIPTDIDPRFDSTGALRV